MASAGCRFPALLRQRSNPQQVLNNPDYQIRSFHINSIMVVNCDVVMIVIMVNDEQGRHAGKNRNPDHGRYEQVSLLFHLHKKKSLPSFISFLVMIIMMIINHHHQTYHNKKECLAFLASYM